MKIIIAVALCMALVSANIQYEEKDSQIHYEYDTNKEGVLGFFMKGVVDPIND